ncbi:hypothetical protein L2E82_46154 [Cichorium intybus]|uniref:Uncharacterized protein n=1 Tax=Cichorium intybus TaxID=13427 RepID=A0ACB8YUA3_CICIN|nr:hypothetical protein L2E82_46154 [Cichorium intybus]
MGQIVRRKRRGRPSNTDRARINNFTAPPSPVDRRRSRRRRNVIYNFDIDDYVDDDEFYDDEDEEVGRREKKLRLLLCEDDSRSNTRRVRHAPASSSSDEYDVDEDFKYSKKRKIDGGDGEDDEDNEFEEIGGRKLEEEDEEEEEEEAPGASDFVCGAASDLQKGAPLPDKRTLELILDKLQKKDTYGVYAEPVDPDELPDYHDVIKHPMDFATVRKKLAKGAYLTLKEFESDVYLICTNAMQYNAPDTIYYKQASSIQEQAKLRFQRLRANVDRSEIEPNTEHKTRPSFSPPKKQLKKPVQDHVGSETLSGGANVRIEEFPNASSAQTPVRPVSSEALIAENSSLPDNSLDKEQELLPGKGCSMPKLGRKPVYDENKRATYNTCVEPVTESDSIFSIFEGESKQFIPVGLHVDHSYARSLARFAATLGSVAWKVASQTIEQALPAGVKYGRGWVGEYEPLPTQVLIMPGDYTAHFEQKASTSINRSPNVTTPLKQQSFKEHIKDPKPPFFSSNRLPQVEPNPPPQIITRKPVHNIPSPRPGNLVPLPSFKHPNHNNDGFAPGRPTNGNPIPISREQPQQQTGLSDPVQMMKMLAERGQGQQNKSNSFGFGPPKREDIQIGSRRDDSSNVAAQAWMSLGGTHKQQNSVESLYNNRQQQPQASRFRGEVHFQGDNKNAYQQPVQAFVMPPVAGNNIQNRHMGFPQLVTADLSRFQVQPSWRGVAPQMQQLRPKQQESRPPDLNIGYQSSPVRQSTGMLVDSQQPDLALQL